MSMVDELEKLGELRKKGILTEKEFQSAKKEILSDSRQSTKRNVSKKKNKPSEKVTDAYVWIIAVSPIVLNVLLNVVGIGSGTWGGFFVWFIFNSIFCVLDDNQIQKAYKVPSNVWYLFLVPVYLYKRADIVGDNKAYFWTWLGCFILSIL